MSGNLEQPGIALVTGGTGMVGKHIAKTLLERGWKVRVLTRRQNYHPDNIEIIHGHVNDIASLKKCVDNVDIIFHCAAELNDSEKMRTVNVDGTDLLLDQIADESIKFFCYISSVGVFGRKLPEIVNENTTCNPLEIYEKTKYEAEIIVRNKCKAKKICILRPTNIIDHDNPGIVDYAIRNNLSDIFHVFLKGAENTHIILAKDVAEAAVYFIDYEFTGIRCFIISSDDEPNRLADVYSFCRFLLTGRRPVLFFLPGLIPYMLRLVLKGSSIKWNIKYSSDAIRATGFNKLSGVEGAIRNAINNSGSG